MEVTRRRGRRRKKLLADLKDRRGYSHLKEETLRRTMWRNRFGGGFEPVVRQNTEWMNKDFVLEFQNITSKFQTRSIGSSTCMYIYISSSRTTLHRFMRLRHGTKIFRTISLLLSGRPLEHTSIKLHIVLRSVKTQNYSHATSYIRLTAMLVRTAKRLSCQCR